MKYDIKGLIRNLINIVNLKIIEKKIQEKSLKQKVEFSKMGYKITLWIL